MTRIQIVNSILEQIEAGACGLKDHEDWGTTAAVIDASLKAATRQIPNWQYTQTL